MKSIKDISPRNDILRPTLEFAGGPVGLGAMTTAASLPLSYLLFSRISKKSGTPDWRKRAAIIAGLASTAAGYGAYALSKDRRGLDYETPKDFANALIGEEKTASEVDISFNKGTLMQGVDEMNITDSQRDFLTDGIKFAPGNSATTLWGLSSGFGQATDDRTGGILPHITRAIEGGIIGGAFGALAGLSPTDRKWAKGVGAVLDSLHGSKLFNAIGELL